MNRDLSTLEWKEVQEWLQDNGMEQFIKNFQTFNVNGYDLCYLANEDFAEMSITNFHDKNIILKNIRMMTLEELKLNMLYEGKRITVQLDFEPSFTAEMLAMALCDLFHIQDKIYLSTADGEVLMPNIKIVELILLNPKKYKQLKILSEKDSYSIQSSKVSMNNAYGSGNQIKSFDESSNENQSKFNDTDSRLKATKDNYPLYDQPKKYEKNDIEKEYLMYKESKKSNISIDNINPSSNMINEQISSQNNNNNNKSEQYKSYKDKELQRSYSPLDMQRYSVNVSGNANKLEQQGSNYLPQHNNFNDPNNLKDNLNLNLNEMKANEDYSNYSNNNYYSYDKSKPNLNNDFRPSPSLSPSSLDNNIQKEQYRNYNVNNNQPQTQFKEDSRKYASEKRIFRSSDPNANDHEILMKPSEKYSNYNNERQQNEDPYIRKPTKEEMDKMNNTQNKFDSKLKMRAVPTKMNYEFESSTLGLKGKQAYTVSNIVYT